MTVMSLRLSEKEAHMIAVLAKEEGKEKSSEARELIQEGVKFKLIVGYRRGKVSLGTLSRQLGVPMSEVVKTSWPSSA
jgi:ribosomal protein L35AE/L33A